MKNGRISMRVHRSTGRIRTILVTGCVATCVVLAALSLLSVPAAKAGGTLEVGEETLTILYRTIGENQSIRQAIGAAFGQATPETSRLLGLSSEQLGQTMIHDQSIALGVLSSGSLSTGQQTSLAAMINAGRLSQPALLGRMAAEESLLALPKAATPSAADLNISTPIKRTWTLKPPSALSGWGDISLDPPVTIPLMTIKQNQVQITVDTIPIGKPAAAATAAAGCVTISCLNHDQLNAFAEHLRDMLAHPTVAAGLPAVNPTQPWLPPAPATGNAGSIFGH
jgi:hypothetical protein